MQTSLSDDLFGFKSSEFQAFMLLQASLYWLCLCQQVQELGGPWQCAFYYFQTDRFFWFLQVVELLLDIWLLRLQEQRCLTSEPVTTTIKKATV